MKAKQTLDAQRVYAVNRDDPAAWEVVQALCRHPLKPGMFIPLTGAQFKALRKSVLVLELPPESSNAP